jgi:hypothetical protein
VKDAQNGLDMIKSKLRKDTKDGKDYWFIGTKVMEGKRTFLLSIFDEYTIAYKDRSDLGGENYFKTFINMGNALTSVMIVDGQVVGTWKRTLKKDSVHIALSPLRKLNTAETKEVEKVAKEYGEFLGLTSICQF